MDTGVNLISMSKIIIFTGPQGSGNHLFAKIMSRHPDVYGWSTLCNTEWEGHDKEPFNKMWSDPSWIDTFDWKQSKTYIASISCPYFDNGVETVPQYWEVLNRLVQKRLKVKLVIIGRDQNVLGYQEERVRGKVTFDQLLQQMPQLSRFDPTFVSQELLYLYKQDYLRSLARELHIPIAIDDLTIAEMLNSDTNAKYFAPAGESFRDALARQSSAKNY